MVRVYDNSAAIFRKTRELYGALSNMASGYPLTVGDHVFESSEALYQACRYPDHPDVQAEIAAEKNAFKSKLIAKAHKAKTRPDWEQGARVAVMHWAIRVKLIRHLDRFGEVLLSTGMRPIVEFSSKDGFWGALPQRDGTLVGENMLGILLSDLREEIICNPDALAELNPPDLPNFLLMGRPVPVLRPA